MANGTRSAPSYPVKSVDRQGPADPWTAVSTVSEVAPALSASGPLSAVKITIVSSEMPSSLIASSSSPV